PPFPTSTPASSPVRTGPQRCASSPARGTSSATIPVRSPCCLVGSTGSEPGRSWRPQQHPRNLTRVSGAKGVGPRIVIVGGGSRQWGPKLTTDILTTPSLTNATIVLHDIDAASLSLMGSYCERINGELGTSATIEATTDRKVALTGADFVAVTITTGAFASMRHDLEIPAKYGVRQSVGDTCGPGGINRSLRNIPVLVDIARDMESHCPDAWLLNLTNPITYLTRGTNQQT